MASKAFEELLELISTLRDPADGCPWDRAQDHQSLRPYMLEEAHEAIAAIDSGNPDALAEELGDVLLQVVLHSQIASERDEFTIADVIEHLQAKLIRRHPHVFADASNDLPDIVQRWEEIKSGEKTHKPRLPILLRARKAVARAPQNEWAVDETVADPEIRAGIAILEAIRDAWQRGIDPELALERAVEHTQEAT